MVKKRRGRSSSKSPRGSGVAGMGASMKANRKAIGDQSIVKNIDNLRSPVKMPNIAARTAFSRQRSLARTR